MIFYDDLDERTPPHRPAWQDRVWKEKIELDERLAKLRHFLVSAANSIDFIEYDALRRQSEAMQAYSDILAERIGRFK